MHSLELVKTFVSLLALVNPLGAVPFFISYTVNDSLAERARITRVAALSVIVVIGASSLIGQWFLDAFKISVDAFEVGGGIVMLLMAVSMINAEVGGTKHTQAESVEAESKASIAVVPLAIPLLAGPGTISTVIVYAGKITVWWEYLGIIGCGVGIGLVTYVALSLAQPIARLLGQTGINVVTRIMGLMLAALAAEFIIGGVGDMLPGLKRG